jgi:hypothetical protein
MASGVGVLRSRLPVAEQDPASKTPAQDPGLRALNEALRAPLPRFEEPPASRPWTPERSRLERALENLPSVKDRPPLEQPPRRTFAPKAPAPPLQAQSSFEPSQRPVRPVPTKPPVIQSAPTRPVLTQAAPPKTLVTPTAAPHQHADWPEAGREFVEFKARPATAEPVISGPTPLSKHPFRTGRADGQSYTVSVNGQNITVNIANSHPAGTKVHTVEQVARALAGLPNCSRSGVRSVNVEPFHNQLDAMYSREFGRPNFRSYMTAGLTGDISIYPTQNAQPQSTLTNTLLHESGHVLSQRRLGTSPSTDAKWKEWAEASKKDGQVPSQYARASQQENFAETFVLYHRVRKTPEEGAARRSFPNTFKIIDELYHHPADNPKG